MNRLSKDLKMITGKLKVLLHIQWVTGLSLVLKTLPIGIAYAIWSGAGILLIALVGWMVFEQTLDAPAMIGMGFIITGIVIMNVFSSSVSHG